MQMCPPSFKNLTEGQPLTLIYVCRWGVKLTIHLHLMPRLGKSGAIPLLPKYAYMAGPLDKLYSCVCIWARDCVHVCVCVYVCINLIL